MKEKIEKSLIVVLSAATAVLLYGLVAWFRRGGPVMLPVLFCSVFGTTLIAAKLRQLAACSVTVQPFMRSIIESLERQRIKDALDLCDKTAAPLSRVVKAGIMKYDRPKDEIREAMDDAFLYESPVIEESMDALMTTLQVTPFLGFLGTLMGLIEIMRRLEAGARVSMAPGLGDVGPGLWQVLICSTTAFCVVIPLLLGYNFLAARGRLIVRDIEKAATELLQFLMERRTGG